MGTGGGGGAAVVNWQEYEGETCSQSAQVCNQTNVHIAKGLLEEMCLRQD